MTRMRATAIRLAAAALAPLLASAACSRGERYAAKGVVEDVEPESAQIVIAHGDIPGLMPAMTMSFDVADRELLATLRRGDAIDFELSFTGNAWVVTAATVTGHGGATTGGGQLGRIAALNDRAPPFALIDQDGRTRSLEELRGRVVLIDFVFTHCPGPCPILTGLHVDLQRRLPPALRERTRFVSISLDPARDTPAALREYALERGADLATWSFLTGPPADVDAVLESYGIGSTRTADGTIEHVVATLLVDPAGLIRQRWFGLEDHDPEELLREIERLGGAP